jgi:hypothetical protein
MSLLNIFAVSRDLSSSTGASGALGGASAGAYAVGLALEVASESLAVDEVAADGGRQEQPKND